jgi:hypothetical protein
MAALATPDADLEAGPTKRTDRSCPGSVAIVSLSDGSYRASTQPKNVPEASGPHSIDVDKLTRASGPHSNAVDKRTGASESLSIAIDKPTDASDSLSIGVDRRTDVSDSLSIEVDQRTDASDSLSIVIDKLTEASEWHSIEVDKRTDTSPWLSIVTWAWIRLGGTASGSSADPEGSIRLRTKESEGRQAAKTPVRETGSPEILSLGGFAAWRL